MPLFLKPPMMVNKLNTRCYPQTVQWRGSELPYDPGYHLFYNYTAESSYAPEFVKILSESILSLKSGSKVEMNISMRDYPSQNRFSSYNVVAQSGATWFFVPPVGFSDRCFDLKDDHLFCCTYRNCIGEGK